MQIEGFKKERFDSQVDNLFDLFHGKIINYAILNNTDSNDLTKDATAYFKIICIKFGEYVKEWKFINYNDSKLYNQLISLDKDIHKSDAEIIVDSYGIYKLLGKNYNFVTNDKGILKHSKGIKKIFYNHFEIINPNFKNPYPI